MKLPRKWTKWIISVCVLMGILLPFSIEVFPTVSSVLIYSKYVGSLSQNDRVKFLSWAKEQKGENAVRGFKLFTLNPYIIILSLRGIETFKSSEDSIYRYYDLCSDGGYKNRRELDPRLEIFRDFSDWNGFLENGSFVEIVYRGGRPREIVDLYGYNYQAYFLKVSGNFRDKWFCK